MSTGNSVHKLWRRRDVIKLLGARAITGPIILRGTIANAASSKVIKLGHVSSPTGVFAPFAEADPFILDQIRTALGKGIRNGGAAVHHAEPPPGYQGETIPGADQAASLTVVGK